MIVKKSLKNRNTVLQLKLNFFEKIYGGAYLNFVFLFFLLSFPMALVFYIYILPLDYLAPSILALVLVSGSLSVWFFSGRFPKITLNKERTVLMVKKHMIQVSPNDAVIIVRRLVEVDADFDSDSTHYQPYHRIKWFVYYKPEAQKEILLASYWLNFGDGFDELAETIAELLGISLIDRTGEKDVIRSWNAIDEFVGDLVSRNEVADYELIDITRFFHELDHWFHITQDGSQLRIIIKKEPIFLALLFDGVKALIGLGFIVYGIVSILEKGSSFLSLFVFFFVAGLFFYFVRRSYSITISPRLVTGKIKYCLPFQRKFKELPTLSIERVLVFNDIKRLFLIKLIPCYGIEFMSDHGRLKIDGIYTKEMAYQLRNTFLTILSQTRG